MKKIIIKFITILLIVSFVIGATACGRNNETQKYYEGTWGEIVIDGETLKPEDTNKSEENNISNTNQSESAKVTETTESVNTESMDDTTTNSSSEDLTETVEDEIEEKKEIKPVKEDDVILYIAGAEIKLNNTYEEFVQIANVNNWIYSEELNTREEFPTEENNYFGYYFVETNIGAIKFYFMPNKDNTEPVIRKIIIYNAYLKSLDPDNIDFCGATITTTHEELQEKLEIYDELPTGVKYKLDDWVFLSFWETDKKTGVSTIMIERTIFEERETE